MPSGASHRDTRNKGVTRAMVAAAAVATLHDEGVAGLSMRRVALRLGVSATALYNHVRCKDDLLALVADELRAQVVVDPALPPRSQLLSLLTQLRDLGAQHPALLDGSAELDGSPVAAELAVLELRLLSQLGLTPAQVKVAYQGLVLLVTGAAVVWRAAAARSASTGALRQVIRATASAEDQQLLAALDAIDSGDEEAVFVLAVDQVLSAAAALRP